MKSNFKLLSNFQNWNFEAADQSNSKLLISFLNWNFEGLVVVYTLITNTTMMGVQMLGQTEIWLLVTWGFFHGIGWVT